MILRAADLFAGAGGASTGLLQAAAALGASVDLTAINHWPIAVETHAQNHPEARHICESLDSVDPRKTVGGRLDVLWASPECTHHSRARGGKPMQDQSRATAWHVVRWAEALRPKWIGVENVLEFEEWAPLGLNGKPLRSRKGETFLAWLNALRSLGYTMEVRRLCSANFGGATTRTRLFVLGRYDGGKRGCGPIAWPDETHAPRDAAPLLFGGRQPWRAAREIIDWSLRGRSIFGREKPLAENTLRRIAAGARKFWGLDLEPFIVGVGGPRLRVAQSLDEPLPTITCTERFGLVQPFLVPFYGERDGQRPRTHSIDHPLATVVWEPKFGLAQPFLIGQQSGATARPVNLPAPTLATGCAVSLVEPFVVSFYGGSTVVTSTREPLRTLTTTDRHGLVARQQLDITFRMLQVHEGAAAMGFPDGYRFAGTKRDQMKQIGNAVEVNQARALCEAMVEDVLRRAA